MYPPRHGAQTHAPRHTRVIHTNGFPHHCTHGTTGPTAPLHPRDPRHHCTKEGVHCGVKKHQNVIKSTVLVVLPQGHTNTGVCTPSLVCFAPNVVVYTSFGGLHPPFGGLAKGPNVIKYTKMWHFTAQTGQNDTNPAQNRTISGPAPNGRDKNTKSILLSGIACISVRRPLF